MPGVGTTVEKLSVAQQGLLRAADAVPAPDWNTRPGAYSWSAAQLVAHLCQVERGILDYADRVVRKNSTPSVDFQAIPPADCAGGKQTDQAQKSGSAAAPAAELFGLKETMLAELRSVRERTLSFLEETHGRYCSAYCWRHLILGTLNFYDWFTFVAAHQIRRTEQMVEIWKNLPKHIASSQK